MIISFKAPNYLMLLHAEVGNSLLQQWLVYELQNPTAHSCQMLSKFFYK